jgi:hypothetical protein
MLISRQDELARALSPLKHLRTLHLGLMFDRPSHYENGLIFASHLPSGLSPLPSPGQQT